VGVKILYIQYKAQATCVYLCSAPHEKQGYVFLVLSFYPRGAGQKTRIKMVF
jgi:hypothetical protein